MSSVLPQSESGSKWLNIGTRAGNVKPSTGYAFKNMYKQAKSICSKKDLQANKVSPNQRFLFYDQLLLIILTLWPTKGKPIFEKLFKVKSSYFVLTLKFYSKLSRQVRISSTAFASFSLNSYISSPSGS